MADYTDWDDLIKNFTEAEYLLKRQAAVWMREWCIIFLQRVGDEIETRGMIDTGRLFKSFTRGDADNIWIEKDSGLTIEVGSCVEYAAAVNNGHYTIDKNKPETYFYLPSGEMARFVPGYWSGNKFIYDPASYPKGMVLKQQFVDAKPFFSHAVRKSEEPFEKYMSEQIEYWVNHYFGN